MTIISSARWIGAIGAAVAAYAHVSLYFDGYRDIPVANLGTQFLLNAAGGLAIALGLVVPMFVSRLRAWTTTATAGFGVVWAAISLLAYTLSHSDRGWMGYNDGPAFFQPSPEGAMTVFGELAVLISCAVIVAFAARSNRSVED